MEPGDLRSLDDEHNPEDDKDDPEEMKDNGDLCEDTENHTPSSFRTSTTSSLSALGSHLY